MWAMLGKTRPELQRKSKVASACNHAAAFANKPSAVQSAVRVLRTSFVQRV
jgi:hypothetical protein